MAIENTYLTGNAIQLGSSGFDLAAPAPLDTRTTVPTYAGLAALKNGGAVYEGMRVYVEASDDNGEKGNYQYINGEWKSETKDIIDLVNATATAAMEFKGVAATLPENPSKGDMYKVAGENISIKIDDVDAKFGDSIVYNGEQWFLIPSGDDIEDTWRTITGVDNDATLTFAAGDKLDVAVAANGTITYSHEAIDAPELLAENEQTRTYITEVETDGFGHITGYKTATENVVDTNTTYTFEGMPMAEGEDGNETAPSSVYFQVTSSEEGATAEVIYLDAYTRNEADDKFVAKETSKSLVSDAEIAKLAGVSAGANKTEASATNGKIKIDGVETTVYAHPDKHAIADVDGLQDALNGKVASVTAGDASITVDGTETAPTVAVKLSAAEGNALVLADDGLKVIIPASTKVEASDTNGNIKVDGEEVTVYAHPDKHAIDDVTDLQKALDDKVDKVTGKGLSTNDLTDELKGQYDEAYAHSQTDHAPVGAQANIIESVKVNGTALEIKEKAVDIAVPTGALAGKDLVAKDDLAEALKTELDNKQAKGDYAAENHTHTKSEITDFTHTHTKSEITDFTHTHTASEITDFAAEVAKVKVGEATKADAATKVDNALTVKVGGADVVFDGSAAKTADVDEAIKAAINAANLGQYAKTEDLGDLATLDTITANKVTDFATEVAKVKVNDAAKADEATKATQDGDGNVISETYATKATTLAGYGIGDAYTKTEIDALLSWGSF